MNEYINHCGSVRMRIKGSGVIRGTLYSYDEIQSDTLNPTTMLASTDDPMTLLGDLTSFAIKLDLRTTGIDEVFNISQIIIFNKPVASSFPM